MLTIRNEQIDLVEQVAWQRFEEEMIAHSQLFAPQLARVLAPDDQLGSAVRSILRSARALGLSLRGSIRLFLELALLFGSSFDSDPQYAAFARLLRAPGDEMLRAQKIYTEHNTYLQTVTGSDAANVHRALSELLVFTGTPLPFSEDSLEAGLFAEMQRMFPQKVAYSGRPAIAALISEGLAEARRHGLTEVRHQALIVILMFAFGHGCTGDPLYPWIGGALRDERLPDPAARAKRLEARAMTWLKYVLANNYEGSPM